MRQSRWPSWTGAARLSWRRSVEASRRMRRRGRKRAGRDTTLRLLNRLLATEQDSTEDSALPSTILVFCFWIEKNHVLWSLRHKMSHCKLTARVSERDDRWGQPVACLCTCKCFSICQKYLNLDFPLKYSGQLFRSVNRLCLWDSRWKID